MRMLLLVAAGAVVALAFTADSLATNWCTANWPDSIFCDDFDTYGSCSPNGGEPGDPDCPVGGTTAKHDPFLRRVWYGTSVGGGGGRCGSEYTVEDALQNVGYYPPAFNQSGPFGARYPCQGDGTLGQQTFRDWILSPLPTDAPGQVYDMHRLVGEQFGPEFTAVNGTDDTPLILTFFMSGQTAGKIDFASGYNELAMNDDAANTDYVLAPDCATYCNPPIAQGPFPIICAQGNPDGALPAACPSINTAPIHASIAVGVLALVDTDPCHCGSTSAHGGQNSHLVVYDGKQWLNLRLNNPKISGGEVFPYKSSTPMPPPYSDVVPNSGVPRPGSFVLASGANYSQPRAYNWVTLTIKSTTFSVQMDTLIRANSLDYTQYGFPAYDSGAYQYWIRHVMENIPRQYLGPFNTMRGGVGSGCVLTSGSWTSCAPGEVRKCIRSYQNSAGSIAWNDFSLHHGVGYKETGACCTPALDAACQDGLYESDCAALGGSFRGKSTTCAALSRPCCPKIYGDANYDGSVDMTDFASLQACLGAAGTTMSSKCLCFDRNSDGTIDPVDIELFISCAQGPGVPGLSGTTGGTPSVSCNGVGW